MTASSYGFSFWVDKNVLKLTCWWCPALQIHSNPWIVRFKWVSHTICKLNEAVIKSWLLKVFDDVKTFSQILTCFQRWRKHISKCIAFKLFLNDLNLRSFFVVSPSEVMFTQRVNHSSLLLSSGDQTDPWKQFGEKKRDYSEQGTELWKIHWSFK